MIESPFDVNKPYLPYDEDTRFLLAYLEQLVGNNVNYEVKNYIAEMLYILDKEEITNKQKAIIVNSISNMIKVYEALLKIKISD